MFKRWKNQGKLRGDTDTDIFGDDCQDSKNILIFRLVYTPQTLTVLIFVSKVNRSAKLTLT